VTPQPPTILSASRRTDIPAFYLEWFLDGIRRGSFEAENPFNLQRRTVPATPAEVHSIVFWSKDYGPFLAARADERLARRGYRLFFHFTLNSADRRLEPHVPPLERRLAQLRELARRTGAAAVTWRFDPICFYTDADGRPGDNLGDAARIADAAAAAGVTRCITSVMDDYAKIRRRTGGKPGLRFHSPPEEAQAAVLARLADLLAARGIALATCCEKRLQAHLPAGTDVAAAACIEGLRLAALTGRPVAAGRDRGQRAAAGCRCTTSVDIGSYRLHPCRHDCLYCYANPQPPGRRAGSAPCASAP
jgi:hypothetical protein